MLIFENSQTKVYGCQLTAPGRVAEKKATCRLLAECFPDETPEIRHLPTGAPYLCNTSHRFNISVSHSRSMALLAISPLHITPGIDTETPDRIQQLKRVASRFLSVRELPYWSNHLLEAWCMKEALYKAILTPGTPLDHITLPHQSLTEAPDGTAVVNINDTSCRLQIIQSPIISGMTVLALGAK